MAETVMGLQTVVVCIMAATLFGMLRRRGDGDAEESDPMGADGDNDADESSKEAERRVARAAMWAMLAGAVGAVCVASVST